MQTYIDEEDGGHDPGEVVGEDLEQGLEHALVVDDVPEEFLALILRHLFAVLEASHDLVFLSPVRLRVHIVSKAHFFVLQDIVSLFSLDEQVSRVNVRILVRVVSQTRFFERFLEFFFGESSRRHAEQLVVVHWFFCARTKYHKHGDWERKHGWMSE